MSKRLNIDRHLPSKSHEIGEVEMRLFKRHILPMIVAVIVAAIISGIWYSPMVFGRQWVALRSEALHVAPDAHIAPWKPAVEIIREFVVAFVITHLVIQLRIIRLAGALRLGFWVWLGFPVSMLVGSSLWDNKPWALSAIHGGDWLTKMLIMSSVIMFTRRLALAPHELYPAGEVSEDAGIGSEDLREVRNRRIEGSRSKPTAIS
jgi:hypothetical protein